jgi:Branched-chain polyamine synthase A C-terminal domain
MSSGDCAGSEAGAPAPITAVQDLVAARRPDSRRLRELIALLTDGPRDLAALIRCSALPRRTVESVLSALADDLTRDGAAVMIRPAAAARYRERFGYAQLSRTRLADPLAARIAGTDLTERMAGLVAAAPPARPGLDHVPATPQTVVRRALWLDSTYDLQDAVLLCVGDHDLTSLAVGLVSPGTSTVVVDVDEETLEFIDDQAGRLGISVRCLAGDLRFGLPRRAAGCADLVFTDPPYTPEGVGLFAERGLQGLANREHGRIIMAYGSSDLHPALGLQAQSAAHRLALAAEAVLPRFNRYTGAQAVGSASDLYVWRPTARTWRILQRPAADTAPAIYTHGQQAVEASQPALDTVPAIVRRLASEAGTPLGALVGSRWGRPDEGIVKLRLGTLLAGGLPAAVTRRGPLAVAVDLSEDPGALLLRALLAANAAVVMLLVRDSHPDVAGEAAQRALAGLVRAKYRLRFLRGQPDSRHAIVLATEVDAGELDPPSRLAHWILRRGHGSVGSTWREGLVSVSQAGGGQPLTKREARAAVQSAAADPQALDTRLLELPRHQVRRMLDAAAVSARDLARPARRPGGLPSPRQVPGQAG